MLILAAALAVAALVVALRFLRVGGAITVLRACAVAVILSMLLGVEVVVPRRAPVDWVVVVDGSASMALEDTLSRTRATRALSLLPQRVKGRPALVVADSATWVSLARLAPTHLRGTTTDLAWVLAEAARHAPQARTVLLVTDGRTEGADPASEASRRGLRVCPVPAGSEGEPPDVVLEDVVAPTRVEPGQPFPVVATVRLDAPQPAPLTARLRVGGEEVQHHDFLGQAGAPVAVRLTCPGLPQGTSVLEVAVDPLPGERVRDNNAATVAVEARDQRIRVHVVADAPGWDVAFLLRSLRRDGGFVVTQDITGIHPRQRPDSMDVLVLFLWGGGGAWRAEAQELVRRGGAVALLGWPAPETWAGFSPLVASGPGTARRVVAASPHPLTEIWIQGASSPLTVPEARALEPASVLMRTEAGSPVLAVRAWEKGQVMAWVGADWWRWSLAARQQDAWPKTIRWLVSPEASARIRLRLGKTSYAAGQPLSLGVEVFAPGWVPAREGTVRVWVDQGPWAATVPLGEALPVITLPGLPPGRWQVVAEARLPSETLQTSAWVSVDSVARERWLLRPDPQTLARLAEATGGSVVRSPAHAESLLARPGLTFGRVPLRASPLGFLLLLGLWAAEWWVRNRRGLP